MLGNKVKLNQIYNFRIIYIIPKYSDVSEILVNLTNLTKQNNQNNWRRFFYFLELVTEINSS